MTNDEEFAEAMLCRTREDAEKFIDLRVLATREHVTDAKQLLLDRLAFAAAYYGETERTKMEELFGAEHPIFGRLRPRTEEALLLGAIWARTDIKTTRSVADLLQRRVEEGKR